MKLTIEQAAKRFIEARRRKLDEHKKRRIAFNECAANSSSTSPYCRSPDGVTTCDECPHRSEASARWQKRRDRVKTTLSTLERAVEREGK